LGFLFSYIDFIVCIHVAVWKRADQLPACYCMQVQADIRKGHRQTVNKALAAIAGGGDLKGKSVLDAGCGTGSLGVLLAQRKAKSVVASDIAEAMVNEASKAASSQGVGDIMRARVGDVEEDLTQKENNGELFDTVCCLDVMIHYPDEKIDDIVAALAKQCYGTLVISFAPETLAYRILKRVGELAPGPSKATRAYLHREEHVEAAIARHGFRIVNRDMTATDFYFSRILISERVSS
jgi:magnesium-protoporphyrin O-methyltransferase